MQGRQACTGIEGESLVCWGFEDGVKVIGMRRSLSVACGWLKRVGAPAEPECWKRFLQSRAFFSALHCSAVIDWRRDIGKIAYLTTMDGLRSDACTRRICTM